MTVTSAFGTGQLLTGLAVLIGAASRDGRQVATRVPGSEHFGQERAGPLVLRVAEHVTRPAGLDHNAPVHEY